MAMRILHYMSQEKRPKSGPTEYVVFADDEEQHNAILEREYSRPGFLLENITRTDDLPGSFPANRILFPEQA